MTRTLFLSARSPFARKIQLLMLEKGLTFEKVVVDLSARGAHFVAISPLGKVPVLQDEDGSVIFDSTVIAEYLEDRYPEPAMLGSGVRERLLHRQLDELGDNAADQTIVLFRGKGHETAPSLDKARQQLDKSLSEISSRIVRGDVPKDFGLGQAAVLSALGYIELRLGRQVIDAHPEIERWLSTYAQRKSVLATPKPIE